MQDPESCTDLPACTFTPLSFQAVCLINLYQLGVSSDTNRRTKSTTGLCGRDSVHHPDIVLN